MLDIQRQCGNIAIIAFTAAALLLAVGMLFYLLFYVLRQGIQFINLNFFTKLPTPNGEPGGGMGEAVQGTLILLGLAALFGIPLGLFTGIYLAEFGRGRFANTVRFLVDMLTRKRTVLANLRPLRPLRLGVHRRAPANLFGPGWWCGFGD